MKNLIMIIPLIFLLCIIFSCQKPVEEVAEEPAVDIEADIQACKDLNDAWDEAYVARDIDKLMSIFADGAVRMPPNEPILIGKEEIRSNFLEEFDQFNTDQKSVVADVKVGGDLAYVRGTWKETQTPKAGGEEQNLSGNFVFVTQRQPDGSWKIICEAWSNDQLILPPQE